MEQENCRSVLLSKLQGGLGGGSAAGPDDHIPDVVSSSSAHQPQPHPALSQCLAKPVYKGMLKVLTAVVHGLEISLANSGLGGLNSAFHLLEISHTHFWSKDLMENVQHGEIKEKFNLILSTFTKLQTFV